MTGTAVVSLDSPAAIDAAQVGAKAANLARCVSLGLPLRPGFVLTTFGVSERQRGVVPVGLRAAWEQVGGKGDPLVVRSSSTVEDASTSSMAGRFASVLDVVGWDAFLGAVDDVIRSAERVTGHSGHEPIAVLVQQQLDAQLGGVMFGVDPISGRRDRIVVEVVPSRPDTLVSGAAQPGRLALTRHGRLTSATGPAASMVTRSLRHELARLARRSERLFGRPQDIEWAVGSDGRLYLLQSRPVTAVAATTGRHEIILGPGPIAETFPDPLTPLEQDLLLEPLRTGVIEALRITGAVSERHIRRSPVIATVEGQAAADLRLLGLITGNVRWWDRVSPAALVRHVGAAWRVGRTRVALPELGAYVVDEVDEHLALLPALNDLPNEDVVDLVDRAVRELASVHRFEVLAGVLMEPRAGAPTTPAVALDELAGARRNGLDDGAATAAHPVVLSLSAPRIGPPRPLPATGLDAPAQGFDVDELDLRDALRLRTRWLQELLVRAALELGHRLWTEGLLPSPEQVKALRWADIVAAVNGSGIPDLPPPPTSKVAPLPSKFVLAGDGSIRPVDIPIAAPVGVPAGGGRVVGTVHHWTTRPEGTALRSLNDSDLSGAAHRTVLVVRHLEPGLAPTLEHVAGVVAETGSPLSHLAILAREAGVAVVASVDHALDRFPEGAEVLIDGSTGEVTLLEDALR
ncbi:MAG: PEP/pyruvate-binding domain-containing protein [Actinomycetes bacterium]